MGKFDGKVVIVTGASSGIGEATALAFAKEGAKVVISGRNEERLSGTAKKCKEAGAQVLEIVCDLTKFETLEALINKTVKKFGAIDVLINNAGYGVGGPIEQLELDVYEKIFQANLRAPVFLCKYAVPHLKKTKGCVVNVSSCASLKPQPMAVSYSMTKIALDHFTRGFSAECAPFGIRVNGINPAAVETKFLDSVRGVPDEMKQSMLKKILDGQPLGFIQSEHIADGILFLCSSPMITGVSMPVDGGFMGS